VTVMASYSDGGNSSGMIFITVTVVRVRVTVILKELFFRMAEQLRYFLSEMLHD
jgi:hypothetical protein